MEQTVTQPKRTITHENEDIDQHTVGLYHKFDVTRRDGRGLPGRDRADASYFVLDLKHDPGAALAMVFYTDWCALNGYPQLAYELDQRMTELHGPNWAQQALDNYNR